MGTLPKYFQKQENMFTFRAVNAFLGMLKNAVE